MSQRHLYLRDFTTQNRRPVGCLVVELDREHNEIRYAFSACSPLDSFDSRVAQAIARGRLTARPTVIKGNVPKAGYEITACVMRHIIAENELQGKGRARSAIALESARGWLQSATERNQARTKAA